MTETEKRNYERYKLAYAAFIALYPFGLENLQGEIWRDIPGYEGHYQESNYGRTKSLKFGKEKILRPALNRDGYLFVYLHNNAKPKAFRVNRLVAQCFIPNSENLPEVNHEDGHKLNSYVENLTRSTKKNNIQHAVKMGLKKAGADFPASKLTEEQVSEIRRIYIKHDSTFGTTGLAKKFDVSASTIRQVVHFKSYKKVK